MILHQQLPHPENGTPLPWFAVHSQLLGICLCEQTGNLITITPIIQENPKALISSLSRVQTTYTLDDIGGAVCRHFHQEGFIARGIRLELKAPSPISNLQSPIPNYILVNSLDGTTPGILHLGDPTALYLSEKNTAILQPTEHFRSAVDLSVEGWTYWWEDAQRAFLKLTIEFAQAVGTPVPEHIAEAARHY